MSEEIEFINQVIYTIEAGWTQGHMAIDESDVPVSWKDPTARKFCLLGAISNVTGRHVVGRFPLAMEVKQVILKILNTKGYTTIEGYNDNWMRTKNDILNLLHEAKDSIIESEK